MTAPASGFGTNTCTYSLRGHTFSAPKAPAGLYLVSTPIGNLADITLRALETLAGSDVIACEDTRTSGVLLKRYGIDRPKVSYTEHNAAKRGPDLLRQIQDGKAVALISDAGTPLVSDPGFRLVEQAISKGLDVIPVPGATAPVAALAGSGMNTDDFRFCGFLPNKAQARLERLAKLNGESETLIFFESPTRVVASLAAICEAFGNDREMVVARELTKMHEAFHRGTAGTLHKEFSDKEKIRGEIVLVVSGAGQAEYANEDIEALLINALVTKKTKDAAHSVAEKTGISRQVLYKQALALKNTSKNDG